MVPLQFLSLPIISGLGNAGVQKVPVQALLKWIELHTLQVIFMYCPVCQMVVGTFILKKKQIMLPGASATEECNAITYSSHFIKSLKKGMRKRWGTGS